MRFNDLSKIQQNILIASIIADGEITKIYPNSRRKNNSYREHYGKEQESYRFWKSTFFDGFLYIKKNSNCLVSRSDPLFTNLYGYFYNESGKKKIPTDFLTYCVLPDFLSILYLDDGSLSISKRINSHKKKIYLTPHIYLYLQNYPKSELEILNRHINETFGFNFKLSSRKDGYGYVLKLTKVSDTLEFLRFISQVTENLKTMEYKYNWEYRLNLEREKHTVDFPNYQVISSDSNRWKNYDEEEIMKIIHLYQSGYKNIEIASQLNRSYWSIVYKIGELRKGGRL